MAHSDSFEPRPEFGAVVTLKQIAAEVGLSVGAVSLALHNSPKISRDTRLRVQDTARRLNYQPNAQAVGMARFRRDSKTKPVLPVLGWMNGLPDPRVLRTYREFDLLWQGANRAATRFGYVLEEFAFHDRDSLRKAERQLRKREVRGVLLPPQPGQGHSWTHLNLDEVSVIALSRTTEPPFTHCVTSAQAANAMLAFDRMREKGYERIGYVGSLFRARMFVAGMAWVQQEVPRTNQIPPFYIADTKLRESGCELADWIALHRPDAILTENPSLPCVLTEIGIRVPQDLGLAATSVLDEPEIDAGIYQNFKEIGRVAVSSLIAMINDRDYGFPKISREILVKGVWVEGASLPDRGAPAREAGGK